MARVLNKLTTKAKNKLTMAVPAFPTATRLMKSVPAKFVKPMKAMKELCYQMFPGTKLKYVWIIFYNVNKQHFCGVDLFLRDARASRHSMVVSYQYTSRSASLESGSRGT